MEGHEGFYDTITVGGQVQMDFVSHYFPNVLDAMRTRWISPQFIATNRIDAVADYDDLKVLGAKVIEALGIGTSATHMEWFFGPKGLKFSEIGCRPPGVGAWDLYSAGNDIDIYRQWAEAVTTGGSPPARRARFSAGIVALAPGPGRERSPGTPASTRSPAGTASGSSTPTCRPRHAHPAGRRRLHGQRLRTDAPPRLRHPARHARRRRPNDPRVRLVRDHPARSAASARGSTRWCARSGLTGPFATVTAGWEEREPDDGELDQLLGGRSVNLRLYARWNEVLETRSRVRRRRTVRRREISSPNSPSCT